MNWFRNMNAVLCLSSGIIGCVQIAAFLVFLIMDAPFAAWTTLASALISMSVAITVVVLDRRQLRQALKEDGYGV